jgi:hypothetical protein
MTQKPEVEVDNLGEEHLEPEGLSGLFAEGKRLASDARTLAEAELAYQASRAKVAAGSAAMIAAWGVGAVFFVFFALMALVLGAVLTLATLVGPLAATGIVVAVLVVAALVCVLCLRARLRRMMALVFPRKADGLAGDRA